MEKQKQSFLEKKGGLDIFFMLAHGPKTFDELQSLNLSPNTILWRLREARTLDIVEQRLMSVERGRSKIKYHLTKRGEEILKVSMPIKKDYIGLREEINRLEEEIRKREDKIKNLLFPLQKLVARITTSKSNRNPT